MPTKPKRRELPYKLIQQANLEANAKFKELQKRAAANIKALLQSASPDPNEGALIDTVEK